MKHYTISQLRRALDEKRISSLDVYHYFKERIELYDPRINSFITRTFDVAKSAADKADRAIASGSQQALTGIPLAHKDLICTEGIKTTASSRMLADFVPPYSATVATKLEAAGTLMFGKLNLDEFAMGTTNQTSYFGGVPNPWHPDYVAGGSSGGSAAAVSAGFVLAATGTDTGGSIRQPASFCGITGIKPTYGRVSRYGIIPYASSLDQAGVLAKSAEDCAYVLQAMSGFDDEDVMTVEGHVPNFTANINQSIEGLNIGIPKEFFSPEADSAVLAVVEEALRHYEKMGARLIEVSLPRTDYVIPAYYTIAPAEASSNLACFDGVRYGYCCDHPKDIEDQYQRTRSEGFGEEVKKRILMGTYVLSAGYYDAYFVKAQQIRRMVAEDYAHVLSKVDVIMGPTVPNLPFASQRSGQRDTALSDIYTVGANLAGLPAMSIPAGFVNGLPVGLQLIGRAFDEARLFAIAHAYQKETDWHLQSPELV